MTMGFYSIGCVNREFQACTLSIGYSHYFHNPVYITIQNKIYICVLVLQLNNANGSTILNKEQQEQTNVDGNRNNI